VADEPPEQRRATITNCVDIWVVVWFTDLGGQIVKQVFDQSVFADQAGYRTG
jgi:chemotaxis regulatin CheY-phosphate phosphatase CheZ